jgi:hypothetical protein
MMSARNEVSSLASRASTADTHEDKVEILQRRFMKELYRSQRLKANQTASRKRKNVRSHRHWSNTECNIHELDHDFHKREAQQVFCAYLHWLESYFFSSPIVDNKVEERMNGEENIWQSPLTLASNERRSSKEVFLKQVLSTRKLRSLHNALIRGTRA